MDSPFVSAIVPWPLDWAPVGFAACNGQQLAVNQYMALYSLIGVTYGGSANVNFNVPDLRGRTTVGMGLQVNPPGTNYQLGQFGGTETNTLVTNNLPSLPPHTHGATFTPTGGGGSGTPTAAGTVTVPVTGTATTSGTVTGAMQASQNTNATGGSNTPSTGSILGSPSSTLTKIYASSGAGAAPVVNLANIASTGTLTGTIQGTASGTISVAVTGATGITGGTVGVQGASAYVGSPQAFENRQPFLVLNFIIAVNGLYPPRP
ncbi:MAG TPA: tail fiber protein [Azospirillaceae bacterium]|nr:tail fiber protein [Azospirillaceae bacterium]